MCVSLLLSIILVFRFLSIRSKGRTNRRTAIPYTVYPSLRERVTNINQGVAFMITFLLFIEYVYLKTEGCQDVTLPEQ